MPVGSYPYGSITIPSSATPTFDLSVGNVFLMTLTSATTVTVINPQVGHFYVFILYQDGVGLHSVTWPANFKGVVNISITALASTASVQTVVYDGNNFYALAAGQINI